MARTLGPDGPTADQLLRAWTQGHVYVWWQAVRQQHTAAMSTSPGEIEHIIAMHFFAVALWNLRRSALMARRWKPAEVDAAVAQFDAAVPSAKEVRNLVEHFDEYEFGVGRMQKSGKLREYTVIWERGDRSATLHVSDFSIDTEAGLAAADDLAPYIIDEVTPVPNWPRRTEPR